MNVRKLKAAMVERGINADELSDKIQMDRSTFYRRLSDDGSSFTLKEVENIRKALNLPYDLATSIFFGPDVA